MLMAFIMVCVSLGGSPGRGSLPIPSAAVRAVGIGNPPPRMAGAQGRLMARRAAEVTALQNLAVKLGLGSQGRLPSFRYVSTTHLANGSVEVTVETTVPRSRAANTETMKKNGLPRRLVQIPGRVPSSSGLIPVDPPVTEANAYPGTREQGRGGSGSGSAGQNNRPR